MNLILNGVELVCYFERTPEIISFLVNMEIDLCNILDRAKAKENIVHKY